jgi:tubulin polyglutamylase TTLL6/13
VILDSALKPVILEVNYTPSFTADTPLDTLIKESLIRDALTLINITNKVKNDALSLKKRELLERTLTGKKTWQSKEERDQLVEKYRLKRNRWEDKHLGNFERIYPPQDQLLLQKYQSFLAHSQQCYLSVTGGSISPSMQTSSAIIRSLCRATSTARPTIRTTPRPSSTPTLTSSKRFTSKSPKPCLPLRNA